MIEKTGDKNHNYLNGSYFYSYRIRPLNEGNPIVF